MARSRRTRAARRVPKHARNTREKRLPVEMVLDASADADYPPVLRSDSDNRG
jgi:hypothetical protein